MSVDIEGRAFVWKNRDQKKYSPVPIMLGAMI